MQAVPHVLIKTITGECSIDFTSQPVRPRFIIETAHYQRRSGSLFIEHIIDLPVVLLAML